MAAILAIRLKCHVHIFVPLPTLIYFRVLVSNEKFVYFSFFIIQFQKLVCFSFFVFRYSISEVSLFFVLSLFNFKRKSLEIQTSLIF